MERTANLYDVKGSRIGAVDIPPTIDHVDLIVWRARYFRRDYERQTFGTDHFAFRELAGVFVAPEQSIADGDNYPWTGATHR